MPKENSNANKVRNAKEKLLAVTYAPKSINVCEHLTNEAYTERKVRYVASQYLDDSYFIFWCCQECAKAHFIPAPGALVSEPEFCGQSFERVFETSNSDDEDLNPYSDLFEKYKKFYLEI